MMATDGRFPEIEWDKPKETPKKKTRARSYAQRRTAFELWWMEYPRKVGKQKAMEAYERAELRYTSGNDAKAVEFDAMMLERAKAFAQAASRWPDTIIVRGEIMKSHRMIPHPTTWLNQGRYDDDPAEWQEAPGSTRTIDGDPGAAAEVRRAAKRARMYGGDNLSAPVYRAGKRTA